MTQKANGAGSIKVSSFLDRLLIEERELVDKVAKLETFMKSDGYSKLPLHHKYLLNKQNEVMKEYLNILSARISILYEENDRE